MSKAQLDLLRQVLGAGTTATQLPLERVRQNFDKLFSRFPTLDDVDLTEVELGGVRCESVDAREDRSHPAGTAIVHLHGGGFVVGSPASHRNLAGRLSRAADAVVVVPEYRLAPEHPHPAQLDDALAVWNAIAATQPARKVLSGDSAGGGLALLAATRLLGHSPAHPSSSQPLHPDALICLSPWADYAGTTPSLDVYDPVDPLVDRPGLELMAAQYLAGRDPWDAEITPLRADLTGLPPTLIQTGGEETLQDDAKNLTQRLREHGVDVELDVWDGMTHAWHLFAGRVDEGGEALRAVGAWLKSRRN